MKEKRVFYSELAYFIGILVLALGTAFMEKADKRKRFAPKKTVSRAREKIGENGYDILHNN
jgi:hypothetical protein